MHKAVQSRDLNRQRRLAPPVLALWFGPARRVVADPLCVSMMAGSRARLLFGRAASL